MPSARDPSAATPRSHVIDIVKGLAISLVVLGHTNQGEIARGWWGASSFGLHLNAFIYSFHMPTFFFASGVFLRQSVDRRGAWAFARQRARTLLYPFVLWAVLMPVAEHLLVHFKHAQPPGLRSALINLVTGNNAWFLPSLFVALMLCMLLRRVPAVALLSITWLAAWFCPPTGILALDRAVAYLPYVVGGMCFRKHLPQLQRIAPGPSLASALLLGTTLFIAASGVTSESVIRWALLPAGFLGTAMLLLLARALEETQAARPLLWVGTASIAVFLLSPFPQGATRTLLAALHCTQPIVQCLLPSFAAITLTAWLYHARNHLHISALFYWPADTSDRKDRGAPRP